MTTSPVLPDLPALAQALAAGVASPEETDALLLALGQRLRALGELGPAQGVLAACSGPAAAHERGLAALVAGALDDADAAFGAVDAAAPVALQAQARANRAAVAFARGAVAEALAGFTAAAALRAEAGLAPDPTLAINQGRCEAELGRVDAALDTLAAAAAQAGPATRAAALAQMLAGERAWRVGDPRAPGLLAAALGGPLQPPERARCLVPLADLRHRSGDTAGAAAALREALPQLSGTAALEARSTLGAYLYLLRQMADAEAVLDAAWAACPPELAGSALHVRLQTNRGLVLVARNRLDEAQAALAAVCAHHRARGDDAALGAQLRALGDLLRYQGDLAGAIAVQDELVAVESRLSGPLPEGPMLYTPVEDRGLNLSLAQIPRAGPRPGTGPVLFLVPPAWGARGPLFPRGAVSVASFLAAHGIPAEVLPLADVVDKDDDAPTAAAKTRDAVHRAIAALQPRAVGISVTFSYLYPQGRALAALAREALPASVPVLIGGPHVTYQDRECLEETPAIDIVVRGEGEWTALETLQALAAGADLAGVPGLTWRAPDGSIQRNRMRKLGDVGALPPVDFSLLPATFAHRMDVSVLTSRGCAFRCRFCHEFRYWGGKVREFPVSRILGEMARLGRYGNHLQGIDDSMLDMSTPFFHELVGALGRSDRLLPDFGLLTRLDTVTVDGARAMKAAGLRWVSMGAESGSQVVLNAMNKGLAVGRIAESLRIVRDAGLEAATFFIVGHPGDTPAESEVTLDFMDGLWRAGLVSWVDISTFTPYPGTPYFTSAEKHGVRILDRDWARWRRTNRPVAELVDYPAPAIYRTFLRMLAVQDAHLRARGAAGPLPGHTAPGA